MSHLSSPSHIYIHTYIPTHNVYIPIKLCAYLHKYLFILLIYALKYIFFSLNSLDKELEFQHGHFLCLLNYRT